MTVVAAFILAATTFLLRYGEPISARIRARQENQ